MTAWTCGKFDIDREQVHTYKAPDDVDLFVFQAPNNDDVQIPRGNTLKVSPANTYTIEFKADGTITFTNANSSYNGRSYLYKVKFLGYHYPTLADLLAAQADTKAMTVDQEYRITLLELGITDADTTD